MVALAALLVGACAGTPAGAGHAGQAITDAGYRATVATLASDAFEGRKPGQPGEQKTLDYLEGEFRAVGLKPAVGASDRQDVPLVEITAMPSAALSVAAASGSATFAYADDMVVWTKRVVPDAHLELSPLVFVGHGIVAPEFGWNERSHKRSGRRVPAVRQPRGPRAAVRGRAARGEREPLAGLVSVERVPGDARAQPRRRVTVDETATPAWAARRTAPRA